jgi:acetylornithine deacetylase/succinyl-diaminopimelate desuccinylase-like protein
MFPDSESPVRGIAAAFILVAFLSWLALRPVQATAPATEFSAARAGADLALLAKTPRPIASNANHQARAWLVERLRAIGLEPQVQRALVQKNYVDYNANYEATMGVVHNVLVRLPGTAPDRSQRRSLLLVAHFDSDHARQGARRAAPVAARLEALRVLRAGPRLANDVLVLFADGERVGSLGMQAFAEQHPWAPEVGLALRFDGGSCSTTRMARTARRSTAGCARRPTSPDPR